jgi:hypothetical protein
MKIRQLSSVAEVVEAVGRERLIAITGRTTQHVTNWIAADRFPPTTYLIITKELQAKRCKARASLWGMEGALARTG